MSRFPALLAAAASLCAVSFALAQPDLPPMIEELHWSTWQLRQR